MGFVRRVRLTGNNDTRIRRDVAVLLQLEGDGAVGGGAPGELRGFTSQEAPAAAGHFELVVLAALGSCDSREGAQREVDDGPHGEWRGVSRGIS